MTSKVQPYDVPMASIFYLDYKYGALSEERRKIQEAGVRFITIAVGSKKEEEK